MISGSAANASESFSGFFAPAVALSGLSTASASDIFGKSGEHIGRLDAFFNGVFAAYAEQGQLSPEIGGDDRYHIWIARFQVVTQKPCCRNGKLGLHGSNFDSHYIGCCGQHGSGLCGSQLCGSALQLFFDIFQIIGKCSDFTSISAEVAAFRVFIAEEISVSSWTIL